MKMSELKDLTLTELAAKGRDLRQELFNLKLQQVSSQLEKSSRIALVRKDIARIETCMTELRRAKATA
jgi:large subunit ribosomal protein L29